jgi:meso-butanediol dehydrogenase/(S,S)-butanediol dehydrogenase/diacetyl reductase
VVQPPNDQSVALVTGAAQGIGRAIALRLARDGFDLAVNDIDRNRADLDTLVAEIEQVGRRAVAAIADVSDAAQVATMVATAVQTLGRLDVTVANAGIARVERLLDASSQDWDRVFAVNARGVFLTYQAAARQYIRQGWGGKLIGASSQAGHRGASLLASYSATKFAVRGLTQAAAQEWAEFAITVNAYAPGIVDTPLWEQTDRQFGELTGKKPGETFKELIDAIPLGRAQTPEDVAALVSFLASVDSNYMTGQTVLMDGGVVFS